MVDGGTNGGGWEKVALEWQEGGPFPLWRVCVIGSALGNFKKISQLSNAPDLADAFSSLILFYPRNIPYLHILPFSPFLPSIQLTFELPLLNSQ